MSRHTCTPVLGPRRFPRVSGDEPWVVSYRGVPPVFSPRERG